MMTARDATLGIAEDWEYKADDLEAGLAAGFGGDASEIATLRACADQMVRALQASRTNTSDTSRQEERQCLREPR